MIEEKVSDSLNHIFESYDKQKKINAASDWEQLRNRITFDLRKRLLFKYMINTATIFLPVLLTCQYTFYILKARKLR